MVLIKPVTWLTTSGIQEAFKSLRMANFFLTQTEEDKYFWKWMLVALHNSLQGFMACSLKGGDGLTPMKDRVAQKWIEAQRNGQSLPHEELDTFLNLYKKIKSERMLVTAESRQFIPSGKQDHNIRKLNRLRNHFVHFTPKSWSLDVSNLPNISQDCLQVIKFLVHKSGNIDTQSEERFHEILKEISSLTDKLKKLEAIYKM